jgi:hypothetical protein
MAMHVVHVLRCKFGGKQAGSFNVMALLRYSEIMIM